MAGRRPKPSKFKSPKDSHRAIKSDPEFPVEVPDCPESLKGEARKEWKRITPELQQMGVIAKVDRAALTGYCLAWAEAIEAEAKIREEGAVGYTEKGYAFQNPYVGILHTALREMRAFLIEFGLTPASRSRLHVAQKATKKANPFADFGDEAGDKETAVN